MTAASKGEQKQLNVWVDTDLLRQAWEYAANHRLKKQELVTAALREFLNRRQRRRRSV